MIQLQNPLLKKMPFGSILDSTTPATITKGTPGAEAPLAVSDVGFVNLANDAGETEEANIMNERTENDMSHSQFIDISTLVQVAPVAQPLDESGSPVERGQGSKYSLLKNYSRRLHC